MIEGSSGIVYFFITEKFPVKKSRHDALNDINDILLKRLIAFIKLLDLVRYGSALIGLIHRQSALLFALVICSCDLIFMHLQYRWIAINASSSVIIRISFELTRSLID